MAGQYQIPEWLIPKETLGQALSRGIQDGATVARGMADNYFRNKDQQRQDALMPLHIQQMQMAVKNQALDLEISQARQQTMLAQKSAYADLATFNAQVASTPNGYLDQNNFAKFWQLGQQHPELISDPVFTQTMGQFDKAKKMKEVEDAAKAQQAYRNSLLGLRAQDIEGKTERAQIHEAGKRQAFRVFKDEDIDRQIKGIDSEMKQISSSLNVKTNKGLDLFDSESVRQKKRYLDLRNQREDLVKEGRDRWKDRNGDKPMPPGMLQSDEPENPNSPEESDTPSASWGAHRQSEDSVPASDANDPWSRFQQSKGSSPASEYINTDDPAAPPRLTTDQIPAWMDQQAQGYDQAPND